MTTHTTSRRPALLDRVVRTIQERRLFSPGQHLLLVVRELVMRRDLGGSGPAVDLFKGHGTENASVFVLAQEPVRIRVHYSFTFHFLETELGICERVIVVSQLRKTGELNFA